MSSNLNNVDKKSEINNECLVKSIDHSNETAANVTIANGNDSPVLDNDRHFYLSSSPDSSSVCTSEGSNIDLANLDEQRQLFHHILDKMNELEQNPEKEKESNIILNKSLKNLENKYRVTPKKVKNLSGELWDIENYVHNIDCRLIESEQYSRRENLIISGIAESIKQERLELKVLEILETIGLSITSYEIAACHRLKKSNKSSFPSQTIIRFTNRKAADFFLANRERLRR